jgi:hypothetical protein
MTPTKSPANTQLLATVVKFRAVYRVGEIPIYTVYFGT